jgi:hypothetical protein
MNNKWTTARFKAYQGADIDKLLARVIPIKDWSHIGRVKASAEPNHIEVEAHFKGSGKRLTEHIKGRTLLGAWRLQSIH